MVCVCLFMLFVDQVQTPALVALQFALLGKSLTQMMATSARHVRLPASRSQPATPPAAPAQLPRLLLLTVGHAVGDARE
jgi:hypothetical protein